MEQSPLNGVRNSRSLSKIQSTCFFDYFDYLRYLILYNLNYKYYLKIIMKNSLVCLTKNHLFRQQFYYPSLLATQNATAYKNRQLTMMPKRGFRQVKNLHEVVYTAQAELAQRTSKYLERTDKVYKPSQTLEFNRDGELLLYSCDNIKNSVVYLKYPYIMYDSFIPLAFYVFFVNPFCWSW